MLVLCWPQLPLSCPYVEPMFAYVGLRNANPHSSDRKGGGDDGVGTARSAAGAARLYNLRLPTEGLRQGHGLGTVPGARILNFRSFLARTPFPGPPHILTSFASKALPSPLACFRSILILYGLYRSARSV